MSILFHLKSISSPPILRFRFYLSRSPKEKKQNKNFFQVKGKATIGIQNMTKRGGTMKTQILCFHIAWSEFQSLIIHFGRGRGLLDVEDA
mmetsp:Transcript_100/g.171  ORF Transcript_100/g.171 Transcript_100/m.171 type:complete len:90 (+) Transcript_100:1004-1273(+)